MGKSNPSARGYAVPTYSTTPITARETFGGPAKAGLGRHIGMGEWTYGAIVDGTSGHKAPPFAGPNFPKAFKAGALDSGVYPISTTNQIGGVSNPSSRYGPTRAPADGVNTEVREGMQKRTDEWNVFWPARPIRDTPNNCGKCSEFGLNFRDNYLGPIFLTYDSLLTATNLYRTNQSKAVEIYGDIYLWETSKIVDKPSTYEPYFNNRNDLNDAITEWYANPKLSIEKHGEMNSWNVSNITTMDFLFAVSSGDPFTTIPSIIKWDTRNVIDMQGMFLGIRSFNQPIGNWNVSNVSNMDSMFFGCETFNQDLSNWFNIVNHPIANINNMFRDAKAFNSQIFTINTVNTPFITSLFTVFKGATSFNQPISIWDVTNVQDKQNLFTDAVNFNQDLSNWDVKNVGTTSKGNFLGMFTGATKMLQTYSNLVESPYGPVHIDATPPSLGGPSSYPGAEGTSPADPNTPWAYFFI